MENILEKMLNMTGSKEAGDVLETFKIQCPIKVISFGQEEPNFLLGAWLMNQEDALDRVKKLTETEYTRTCSNPNNMLFFTNQHIIELAHYLNGMLFQLEKFPDNIQFQKSTYDILYNFIIFLQKPMYVQILCEYLYKFDYCNFTFYFKDKDNPLYTIINRAFDIFKYIPFLTYGQLDELAAEAINGWEAQLKEDEKEEISNDNTTDNTNRESS